MTREKEFPWMDHTLIEPRSDSFTRDAEASRGWRIFRSLVLPVLAAGVLIALSMKGNGL